MHEYLTAEVSASAVAANLSLLRGRLAPGTKLCAVVKANCYGHGVDLLWETIARGADWLAVAAPVEAIHIRDLGYRGPLLVLFSCCGYTGRQRQEAIEELIRRQVTLTVASPEDIGPISRAAAAVGARADVHLKIDSGMGRSGVAPDRAAAMAEAIRAVRQGSPQAVRPDSPQAARPGLDTARANESGAMPLPLCGEGHVSGPHAHPSPRDKLQTAYGHGTHQPGGPSGLHLAGMYTHFATADAPDPAYMRQQLRSFLAGAEAVPGRSELILHAANSAATTVAPQGHLDMVRCGLAVYGYQPADDAADPLPLRPALRVWARLLATKSLPAGATIGYGRQYTLQRPSTVGLVPVGYADGYYRCLACPEPGRGAGRSTMRVAGRDVPVLGAMSMDQTVIDLTDVPGAKAGDVVEVISADPAAPHSVENLARLAGTIPYEVTCRLGPRARRILV